MSKVLIAGIETVVGSNLAVCLGRNQSVAGVSFSGPITLSGCDIEVSETSSPDSIRQIIDRTRPQRIVFCGAGSQAAWESHRPPCDKDVKLATEWIMAAHEANIHLTLISSGAVFTGPWMFHSENSHSFCSSEPAQCLLSIEQKATEICPDSLIVRTHAIGWKPGEQSGWLESMLQQLEQGQSAGLDCFRYASPILASDLADIISRSWSAGLSGLYHIGGAERANPVQVARRIAHYFQLPFPQPATTEFLVDRPTGYGCGETSLQTRKIRRALHVALPMLEEGVLRLFQQHADGSRSRLTGVPTVPDTRVA